MLRIMRKKLLITIATTIFLFFIFYLWSFYAVQNLVERYEGRESVKILDRSDELIELMPNGDGFYAFYGAPLPAVSRAFLPNRFSKFLIEKEDRFFYYHPGINPVSTFRALIGRGSSSTITQQLVKILLDHEKERTVKNKLQEMLYSVALELRTDKAQILEMYANSIYLGNQVQGIQLAGKFYFNVSPENLTEEQIIKLLATIPSPSETNPFMGANAPGEKNSLKNSFKNYVSTKTAFEINSLGLCATPEKFAEAYTCRTTLDLALNEKIRTIVNERLINLTGTNAEHAAVVVFKEPEHELLALVGSPDPTSLNPGYQINMAQENRPIGSTIKPFLYALGFEKGLRPYSLVDDREYKFTTSAGFAHYPKNYDYKYRGIVTLYDSLANSLNVPAVKVLEYIGLQEFYDFLTERLEVKPVQPLETYQYGIALGQLEMDLLELTHLFSVFANGGDLHRIITESNVIYDSPPDKRIFEPKYVQLVNRITTDRDAQSDQFGITNNLRIDGKTVGVKTGTSREYHDSWAIGYTPDFTVGVWVGNAKNLPMTDVSGEFGAGGIWHDTMRLMFDSPYNKDTPFKFDEIKTFQKDSIQNSSKNSQSVQYGLPSDSPMEHLNLLLDQSLILSPHDGDTFSFAPGMKIFLKAHKEVKWYVNGPLIGEGVSATFSPESAGQFEITAKSEDGTEENLAIFLEK